ncbi:MAG: hypothetical protein KDA58_08310 [Planctomycetaceae bacterium]|nr:hypothetical protein [Planctomycetaceae bacterium]
MSGESQQADTAIASESAVTSRLSGRTLLVGATALPLLVALLAFVWRPLNSLERQLVGSWRYESQYGDNGTIFEYHEDRTVVIRSPKSGEFETRWWISGDQLHIPLNDFEFTDLLRSWSRLLRLRPQTNPVPDRVLSVNGVELVILTSDGRRETFFRVEEPKE